jgi:hypothetical protein
MVSDLAGGAVIVPTEGLGLSAEPIRRDAIVAATPALLRLKAAMPR